MAWIIGSIAIYDAILQKYQWTAGQDVTREATGKGECDVKSPRCLTYAQLTYSSPALKRLLLYTWWKRASPRVTIEPHSNSECNETASPARKRVSYTATWNTFLGACTKSGGEMTEIPFWAPISHSVNISGQHCFNGTAKLLHRTTGNFWLNTVIRSPQRVKSKKSSNLKLHEEQYPIVLFMFLPHKWA